MLYEYSQNVRRMFYENIRTTFVSVYKMTVRRTLKRMFSEHNGNVYTMFCECYLASWGAITFERKVSLYYLKGGIFDELMIYG